MLTLSLLLCLGTEQKDLSMATTKLNARVPRVHQVSRHFKFYARIPPRGKVSRYYK